MTALDRASDGPIGRENENPQGLPDDILAGMETDIGANPDNYPILSAMLRKED